MLLGNAMSRDTNAAVRLPQRMVRRSSRPLTPTQERILFGTLFAAGLLLQLVVLLG